MNNKELTKALGKVNMAISRMDRRLDKVEDRKYVKADPTPVSMKLHPTFPGTDWEIIDQGDTIKIGDATFTEDDILRWLGEDILRIWSLEESHCMAYYSTLEQVSVCKGSSRDDHEVASIHNKANISEFFSTLRSMCEPESREYPWTGECGGRVVLFTDSKGTGLILSQRHSDGDEVGDWATWTTPEKNFDPFTPEFVPTKGNSVFHRSRNTGVVVMFLDDKPIVLKDTHFDSEVYQIGNEFPNFKEWAWDHVKMEED